MWMLSMAILLAAGVAGCLQEPFPKPVAEKSETNEEEPESVAEESESVTEEPESVAEEPESVADAVSAIKKLGGTITFNGSSVTAVKFLGDRQITDAGLVHLKGLTSLEKLSLQGKQITGVGLVHLEKLEGPQVA